MKISDISDLVRLRRICILTLIFASLLVGDLIIDVVCNQVAFRMADAGSVIDVVSCGLAALFVAALCVLIYTLNRRKCYSACIAASGFLLLLFPVGIALGAYSLYVLKKPEVRVFFGRSAQNVDDSLELYVVSILNYGFAVFAFVMCILHILGVIYAKMASDIPAFLMAFGLAGSAFWLILSLGSFFLGWAVRKGVHRKASYVMSIFNCFALPFGTAIGVYSLFALRRAYRMG